MIFILRKNIWGQVPVSLRSILEELWKRVIHIVEIQVRKYTSKDIYSVLLFNCKYTRCHVIFFQPKVLNMELTLYSLNFFVCFMHLHNIILHFFIVKYISKPIFRRVSTLILVFKFHPCFYRPHVYAMYADVVNFEIVKSMDSLFFIV